MKSSSQSVLPKQNHDGVADDGNRPGYNPLSCWSDSVPLSNTVDTSEDKPTSRHGATYVTVSCAVHCAMNELAVVQLSVLKIYCCRDNRLYLVGIRYLYMYQYNLPADVLLCSCESSFKRYLKTFVCCCCCSRSCCRSSSYFSFSSLLTPHLSLSPSSSFFSLLLFPSWCCSIVVRPLVLAGELSLSCSRLKASRVTTFWVNCQLSVNQHGQLSQPSLRGRLNE